MEVLTANKCVSAEIPGALALMEDGSVERFPSPLPPVPASPLKFDNMYSVATKDVAVNPCTGTWARIFFPLGVANRTGAAGEHEADDDAASRRRGPVPVVLHFHGGGMCLGSPSDPVFHNFCSRMAAMSNSIWISVAYRLAPEHRIPIQYQDCFEAICWLRSQFSSEKLSWLPSAVKMPWEVSQSDLWRVSCSTERDPWLSQHGDSSKVFLTGESAGATILHFLALHLGKYRWSPLQFRGLMYVDMCVMADPLPEVKPSTNPKLTPEMMAAFVRLCLPEGTKLGHSILNCLHPDSPSLSTIELPQSLVLVAGTDLLFEDGVSYYNSLKQAGKDAEIYKSEGQDHCFHLQSPDSEHAIAREKIMAEFISR